MTGSVIRRVRISAIETLTTKAKKFILEPLDGWVPTYVAGQYLTFIFPHLEGEKRRSYSIVSSPSVNEPLAIAVKKSTMVNFHGCWYLMRRRVIY